MVFFVDAAHFVYGAFLGYLWCLTRLFIPTPAGRQRLNVLGAINAITQEVTVIVNESYINALTVCELLEKIRRASPEFPITLVLDNARYQHCKLVMARAAELSIELLFLPPYSPNLNLIERYWKFLKKKCLASRYYDKFEGFKQALFDGIEKSNKTWKTELATLLTLNFQTFTNAKI